MHLQSYRKLLLCLPTLILLLHASFGNCQVINEDPRDTRITELETSIGKKDMLQQTQYELTLLKQQATKTRDDILLARSLNDLMKINDLRTNDTAYFRNSAFMDTVLNNVNASLLLKAIVSVMQAKRLIGFNNRNLRFNRGAYQTKDLSHNFARFEYKQLDSIATRFFDTALKYPILKKNTERLLWLSSNPSIFLFEPAFEDIVLAENIYLLTIEKSLDYEQRKVAGNWLALPSAAFTTKLDSLAGSTIDKNPILLGYQRWLLLHKTDAETQAFIESLARKYVYLSASPDSTFRLAYISYLQTSAASRYSAVKAHSIYQLCLFRNEQGKKYTNFGDGDNFRVFLNFDIKYRDYAAKALQLYEQNKELMEKFPSFNNVLYLMAQHIKAPGMRIEMADKHLPG